MELVNLDGLNKCCIIGDSEVSLAFHCCCCCNAKRRLKLGELKPTVAVEDPIVEGGDCQVNEVISKGVSDSAISKSTSTRLQMTQVDSKSTSNQLENDFDSIK